MAQWVLLLFLMVTCNIPWLNVNEKKQIMMESRFSEDVSSACSCRAHVTIKVLWVITRVFCMVSVLLCGC